MTTIYTLTIFTSAFLLFLIQPMISKLLLPHLGGSPAVWNTSMMFFQTLLLFGYLYAHISGKWLGPRRQAVLHFVLMAVAFAWLPIALETDLGFDSVQQPVLWVIVSLFLSVGVPFFVLAANAPLLQYWLAHTTHKDAKNPYFLYSASNIGSMLALFSYPILFEPGFTLPYQTGIWSGLFIAFAALLAGCAWSMKTHFQPTTQSAGITTASAPTAAKRLQWLFLAFFPSSLLLGVTTYIATDIASLPLFWVVPLALYLLTFILAFSRVPLLVDRALNAQIVLVPLTVLALVFQFNFYTPVMLLHLFTFFALALGCHGLLARNKPDTRYLTEFYVWMSLGGMLGGVFNSLVAPNLFTQPVEYWLVLILALLARPQMGSDTHPVREKLLDYTVPLAGATALGLIIHFVGPKVTGMGQPVLASVLYLLVMIIVIKSHHRPIRLTLLVLSMVIAIPLGMVGNMTESSDRQLFVERNFFGVNRVVREESRGAMTLMHGTTNHGMQSLDEEDRLQPVSYYGKLKEVFTHLSPSLKDKPYGVIGLGAGTLACFGKKGQEVEFYEIDPAVLRIASNPDFFTYLRDCGTRTSVQLGDGRLNIAKAHSGHYGLIIIDAFSSDAIPVHLLTREALAIYLDKLAPGGLMAFNISNRHLKLSPVMAALAEDAGLKALRQRDEKPEGKLVMASEWVILARSMEDFHDMNIKNPRWEVLVNKEGFDVWADNYSNILQTLDSY